MKFPYWSMFLVVVCGMEASTPLRAQPGSSITPNLDERLARLQKFLSTYYDFDTPKLAKEKTLAQFLADLEKQLPHSMKLTIRLDREAFGDQADAVAATIVSFPTDKSKQSLRALLHAALSNTKPRADYSLEPGAIIITVPKKARYRTEYEVGHLPNPDLLKMKGPGSLESPDLIHGDLAAPIVQAIRGLSWSVSPELWGALTADPDAIRLVNGSRLEINASPATHAEIYQFFRSLRRLADVSVRLQAKLYEVDADFHRLIKGQKRLPLDELEKQFLDGKPKKDPLWLALGQQKLLHTGPEIKVDNDQEAVLLSRFSLRGLLASPEQIRHGHYGKQAVLEGFEFRGPVQVSADRRQIRLKLQEKGTLLEGVMKVKVNDLVAFQKTGKDRELDAETPFLKEAMHTTTLDIPDGGAVLTSVHYRPPALKESKRWYVLAVQARIIIEEEERQLRQNMMADILDDAVADALKNQKLKAIRELHGTPGDQRFALVNSPAWQWPKDFKIALPGHERTAPQAKGKRLLGVRVDHFREPANPKAPYQLSLTLFNAGGTDNGPSIGGATLRYLAHSTDKGWTVELSDTLDP